MTVLFTTPEQQFFNNDGMPLAGGLLYTYAAGTTTPKDTFTAEDGLTQNTNPIVLDSSGRAEIWIDGSYKFVLKDSADVEIYSVDNVTSFSSIAEAISPYFQSFSGNGTQTAFVLSEDVGLDSENLMVYVDNGNPTLVENGTFATDTIWTKGTNWAIGGGVATASGASTDLKQDAVITLIEGNTYSVTYTLVVNSGGLFPRIGDNAGEERTASGTYNDVIVAGSGQEITFRGSVFDGTIDNVVVQLTSNKGYEIQNPNTYTVDGTSLDFSVAPESGTGNIYIFAPSLLLGAAAQSAEQAAASAVAAALSEGNAATSASEAAASALAITVVEVDTTITVGAGQDYATLDLALDAISTWTISKDAILTISIIEGVYTRTEGTVLDHPYGSKIMIEGAEPEDLTVSSLVSITSNGAQDHDVVFQFSSIGSSGVGDTINIRDLTGTGHYKVLEGCWEITAINGGSNQLTVKNTAKDTSISASTVTDGTFKRFKTVLEYNDSVGLIARSRFLQGSSELTGLKNICLVGNGAATYSGVFVDYFAYVGLIREFGIRGFGRHNVYVIYKGGVSMLGVCCSSAVSSGVQALAGSQVQAVSSVSTGNGAYGYVATSTANMACSTANGSGNTTGFAALLDSQITINSGFAVANTSYGSQSDTDSLVRAESHNYLDNGTDAFSQFNSTHKLSGATLVTASPELNHFGNKGALNTDESTATDAVSYDGLRTFDDGIAVTGNIDVDGTVLSDDSLAFSQSEVRDVLGNIELETLSVNRDIKIFGASIHVMTLNLGNSGGNNGYIEFISTGTGLHHGTGSPEGSVTAPIGSQYMRSDGGAGTSFYVKESGTGNTGWVAK